MKRATAIRHANEIAQMLKVRNGMFLTPFSVRGVLKVRRAWIFGSTVKGKDRPNDLDVLLDTIEVDRTKVALTWSARRFVPHAYRVPDRGFFPLRSATEMAMREIRRGRKGISLHHFDVDAKVATPRVMIYPRNDFQKQVTA